MSANNSEKRKTKVQEINKHRRTTDAGSTKQEKLLHGRLFRYVGAPAADTKEVVQNQLKIKLEVIKNLKKKGGGERDLSTLDSARG